MRVTVHDEVANLPAAMVGRYVFLSNPERTLLDLLGTVESARWEGEEVEVEVSWTRGGRWVADLPDGARWARWELGAVCVDVIPGIDVPEGVVA